MKTFALVLAASFLAFSSNVQAQGFGRGTSVVYGNGMLNADGEWDKGSEKIKSLNLDRDLDVLGKVSYDIAINRSEYKVNGLSKDGLEEFYEVAAQKLGELAARKYWLWLSRSELLPPELQQDYIRIASNVMSNPVAGDADLSAHVAKYKAYLSGGSRVLLVSHSQGNLYANQAWNSLFGAGRNSVFVESLGNVQVATPASLLSAGQIIRMGQSLGAWQTFPDDLVIAGVRATFGALPANLPQEGRIGDPALGHNFVNAYMRSGSTALTRVVADMKNVARVLVYPTGLSDLSAAANDSAALADLINDANNLSLTPVEPGKELYLEGSGLGGAQFVVPGVTARLTASAINLPVDHPLYVAGAEVWKLSIPANAVVGSSGVIRAIIAIDGVDQSFESPRLVRITAPAYAWTYVRSLRSFASSATVGGWTAACQPFTSYFVAYTTKKYLGTGSQISLQGEAFSRLSPTHPFVYGPQLVVPGPDVKEPFDAIGCLGLPISLPVVTETGIEHISVAYNYSQSTFENGQLGVTVYAILHTLPSYVQQAPDIDHPGRCVLKKFSAYTWTISQPFYGSPTEQVVKEGSIVELNNQVCLDLNDPKIEPMLFE